MRLIDKDELLNHIGAIVSKFPEEYDEKTYKMIRSVIRNKRREVKTIPIEWMRNYVSVWVSEAYRNFVLNMIKNWEKENGLL